MTGEVERTTLPVPVFVVTPVPPLTTFNVPANVTAPCVVEDGVSPVVPALNVVTALEAIVDVVTKVELAGMVVELIVPAVVFPDNVGVVIVGDVLSTTVPLPVELVSVGASGLVPSPVDVTKLGVVVVFPAR